MPDPTTEPDPTLDDTTCCGRRLPGVAGKPLVLACQLCPNSPTYWRRPATSAAEPEGATR